MTYYGPDRWLYPIKIVSGANVIRLLDPALAAVATPVTITPGTYYQGVGLPSGYTSLPDAIRTGINASALGPGTSTLGSATPAGQTSTILDNSAISYGDATDFYFDFANAAFTFPRRLLGYPNSAAGPPSLMAIDVSMLGSWQSFTMLDGGATDKRRTEMRELYASTQELYSTTRQHSVRDVRRVRKFVYEYMPGLHVYESLDRAKDSAYLATSGLAFEDENNAFESVWRAASDLGDIIIIHDDGSGSALTNVTSRTYEIARLYLPEQRADFRACFSDLSLGGELYRIDVDMLILDGNYAY